MAVVINGLRCWGPTTGNDSSRSRESFACRMPWQRIWILEIWVTTATTQNYGWKEWKNPKNEGKKSNSVTMTSWSNSAFCAKKALDKQYCWIEFWWSTMRRRWWACLRIKLRREMMSRAASKEKVEREGEKGNGVWDVLENSWDNW